MCLGLDIGYSSLKLAAGVKGRQPRCITLPGGAAPIGNQDAGYFSHDDGVRVVVDGEPWAVRVVVDGEPWAARVQPMMLNNGPRVLDEHYAESLRCRALYHAAQRIFACEAGRPTCGLT